MSFKDSRAIFSFSNGLTRNFGQIHFFLIKRGLDILFTYVVEKRRYFRLLKCHLSLFFFKTNLVMIANDV